MGNYNFQPTYLSHMKESLKETFYVKNEVKIIVDNSQLIKFLIE